MNNHAETLLVKQVMQNYMDGTFNANIEQLKSAFHPNAVMNGYLGPDCVIATPAAFIEDIASDPSMASQGDAYHAEIESLRIEGNVAAVVVSETGFRGSASLVDFFQLIKADGEWKIISKLFTTL